MSHIALYRKYRPQTFDEVLGQDAIVHTLTTALASGTLSHAYLFAGSRGTGKTSIARIFARALGTSSQDLYEIDAASHNGVDEIRELREGVTTMPFDSKYKVYILDEVHMLSKAAFNALLKTLEEPPAHVIFILATTEMHKVPETIISRCQVFDFKKPSRQILVKMLMQGAIAEGVTLDTDAAELIAQYGDGAFRDTWGIFDRIIQGVSDKHVTLQEVQKSMSMPHHEQGDVCIHRIVAGDLQGTLEVIHEVVDGGFSLEHFIEHLTEMVRLVLLVRFAPGFAKTLIEELPLERQELITTWARSAPILNAQLVIEFLQLIGDMKKTTMPIIPVELAFIRILGNNSQI
jgi:DNA polymerase-3 subunit gamma/tau